MPSRLNNKNDDFLLAFENFIETKRESEIDVEKSVAEIVAEVRTRGDKALFDFTRRFDRFELDAGNFSISKVETAEAVAQCSQDQISALNTAADRIRAFHQKQLPEDQSYTDQEGVGLGYRWRTIEAVGMYVPGGTASYPSSVLMNAIPAKIAGVSRLVMVVPTPDGEINPLVLAAAEVAGVDEIYRIGGAQAVAALAYGTAFIQPVDKIVGPGNAYVATAKRQVFGVVGIDMIAGPSEILVVADNKNDPAWMAADLMSQAEHDTAAQSILITDDEAFADDVVQAVDTLQQRLPRGEIAAQSWRDFGAAITVENLTEAVPLINRIAPEHLELAVADPEKLAEKINNAGAIFLGRHTPEALGDYVGGPNHVLPTSRSARFSSGLGVLDFLKRTTILKADENSIWKIGPAAVILAEAEGLDAHALSVSLRLNGYLGGEEKGDG